jgi:hypothetical protein
VRNLKNEERFEDDLYKCKKKRNNRFNYRGCMKIKNKIKTMKIYIESENKIQFY